jgi:hypothetical protein
MEKTINKKVELHSVEFKNSIKTWLETHHIQIKSGDNDMSSQFLQFVFDYNNIKLSKVDFQKRKRIKNVVEQQDLCIAKRANGERCTRHKKEKHELCGTHIKGIPHGVVNVDAINNVKQKKKTEVWIQEIKGIHYYIDDSNNVYKTEDILANKTSPSIIASWSLTAEGVYTIPAFGI